MTRSNEIIAGLLCDIGDRNRLLREIQRFCDRNHSFDHDKISQKIDKLFSKEEKDAIKK